MNDPIRFEIDTLARLIEYQLSPWSGATNRDSLECIKKLLAIAVHQQEIIEAQAKDIQQLHELLKSKGDCCP